MTDLQTSEPTTAPPGDHPVGVPPRRRRARVAAFLIGLAAILGATLWVWSDDGSSEAETAATDEPRAASSAPTTEPAPTTTATTAPPTTEPAPPPPLRAPTSNAPLTVWFSGDSTAYTIGNALRNQNGEGLLSIEVRLKTSSGLSRPDFFNWGVFIGMVQDLNPPELMILSMGANDAQGVQSPDGAWHTDIHSPGWRAEYLRRVDELSRRVIDKGTRLYWVGQPIAREPGYNAFVALVDGIYREIDDRYEQVEYIDTYKLLADDAGNYTDFKPGPDGQPVKVRQNDGIHLEAPGGDIVAAKLMRKLHNDWSN